MDDRPGQDGQIRRWWRVLFGLVAIVLSLALWVGFEIYRAYTAVPGSSVDFNAVMWEQTDARQRVLPSSLPGVAPPERGDDAWQLVLDAVLAHNDIEGLAKAAVYGEQYGRGAYCEYDWVGFGRQRAIDEAREGNREEASLGFDAGLEAVRLANGSDLDVVLDRLVRTPRGHRAKTEGKMIEVLLPNLGRARMIARFSAARMRDATQRGETDEVLRSFEHMLAIARTMGNQFTLIDRLVGLAIQALAVTEVVRFVHVAEPDAATCRVLLDAMDRQDLFPELAFQLDSERISVRDTIQWSHTEDGRLLLSEVRYLSSLGSGGIAIPDSKITNAAHMFFPTKEQTLELTDTLFDAAIERSRMTERERIESPEPYMLESLPRRQLLLQVLMPALGSAMMRDSFGRLIRDGGRLVIAIRAYEAERGSLPVGLELLVPAYMDELPTDPFASDGSIRYTVLDTPSPDGRRYLLYSVGYDDTDNGGTVGSRWVDGSRRNGEGLDVPLNLVEN